MPRDRPDVVRLEVGLAPAAVLAEMARQAAHGLWTGGSGGRSNLSVGSHEPLKTPVLEGPSIVAQRK